MITKGYGEGVNVRHRLVVLWYGAVRLFVLCGSDKNSTFETRINKLDTQYNIFQDHACSSYKSNFVGTEQERNY